MNYYTGFLSVLIFNIIFQLIEPYKRRIRYWHGAKAARSLSNVRRTYRSFLRKVLSCKDKFLLTLMRLRLWLQNEDLADRFGISTTVRSNTFKTMIRLLSTVLGSIGCLAPTWSNLPSHAWKWFRFCFYPHN